MNKLLIKIAGNFKLIALIYLVSILLCAFLFSIIEGKAYYDALWYTCVTALTIGYGDMYATTGAGRVLMMVFSHLWVFGIAPLVVVNILERIVEDRNAFTHEEQEEIKQILRQLSKEQTK